MSELNDTLKNFFKHWYSGFIDSLESLKKDIQNKILQECGKACANSYTVKKFQEALKENPNYDSFLKNLEKKLPGTKFEKIGDKQIRVTYSKCECDLVKLDFINSPVLCNCSVFNLKENFEQSLRRHVEVVLKKSILQGGNNCSLLVILK